MKKSLGLTLLEIMLVLAIGASIILMGIKAYQTWNIDKEIHVLKSNVDQLFDGAKSYYQANCGPKYAWKGIQDFSGYMNDLNNISQGFEEFGSTYQFYPAAPWPRRTNVVDPNTDPNQVYFAQFNLYQGGKKKVFVCNYFRTGAPECSDDAMNVINESNIRLWIVQVVVKMRDAATASTYKGMLGANCSVATYAAGTKIDCATATPGAYLVWQQLPSYATTQIRSSHWVSLPVAKQFNLQYTHDPMYEMYSLSPSSNPNNFYRNYLCGG